MYDYDVILTCLIETNDVRYFTYLVTSELYNVDYLNQNYDEFRSF